MTSALQTAKEVFSWAKAGLPSDSELEIFVAGGRGRSIIWSEEKCEDISQAEGGGVGIRLIAGVNGQGGQQGYAFTTDFSKTAVQRTVQRAVDSAQALPADPFRKLPHPASKNRASKIQETLYDPATFSRNITQQMERLKEGEARLLEKYPLLKSVLRAGFSEGISEAAIVSSQGIEETLRGTHSGLGVSCLAEKDGERQEGGFGQSKRFQKDLDWEYVFQTAARRTLALLGGAPIASGRVAVVFDPTVACEFLSLISGAVCADSVQKGKSFLAGKLGEIVASREVSIIDDGRLEKGIASSYVDDEGVPTQMTPVITNGKLEHYLYDTYTALKDRTLSTGSAARAGYKSSPSSGASNFYLKKGTCPREKLLLETTGIYLMEVMGLHMADPISGDFSVGAIGTWLEKGEFKRGVRGITLAGNLLDLFKNVDRVCDDFNFFGSVGSPTFRVNELSVSGL